MCTAFGIVYVITKSQNILMEFINILKCDLNSYTVTYTGKIDRLTHSLLMTVKILDKTYYPVGFMEFFLFVRNDSLVAVIYCKFGIKICRLMKT